MPTLNNLISRAKGAVSKVQGAYVQQKKAADKRAAIRLKNADTAAERETIRAQERMRAANLQRKMYEAKGAAVKAEGAARQARRAAGDLTLEERATGFLSTAVKDVSKAYDSLMSSGKPTPRKRRKTTTKRR